MQKEYLSCGSFGGILLFFLIIVISIRFESSLGDIVEQEDLLVWILENQIFARFEFQAGVDYTPKHTPRIVHVQVGLIGKFAWLELLCAQNVVFGGVAKVGS